MQIDLNGSVTSPAGFQAAAVAANIKYQGRDDLALVYSAAPCTAAGVFTTSQVVAAPVTVDRATLAANAGAIHGVVTNSGNANACTGAPGLAAARAMQTDAAAVLGNRPEAFLVLSTGVIGVQLPGAKMRAGIEAAAAALSAAGGLAAARAIMTTDTKPKHLAVSINLSGGTVTIGGMAKGSGMIHPDMATMLAVVTTDAAVPAGALHGHLLAAVNASFNRISVDGDTSTNDTVLLLANGAGGVSLADEADAAAFQAGLTRVCAHLAQAIVRDGEGASKFVTVTVSGADDDRGAHQIANTIAISPLVKTAFAGSDANWGRIMMAAGRAGVAFDQNQARLDIRAGGDWLTLLAGGTPTDYAEADAAAIFAEAEFELRLAVGAGPGAATVWTCDLTHEYVSINADYRS